MRIPHLAFDDAPHDDEVPVVDAETWIQVQLYEDV
jgi:hypothetical protein